MDGNSVGEGYQIENTRWERLVSSLKKLVGATEHTVFSNVKGSLVIKTTISPNFGPHRASAKYAKN